MILLKPDKIIIKEASSLNYLFKRQFIHLTFLIIISAAIWFLAESSLNQGSWLSLKDSTWLILGILVFCVHQVVVGLIFRLQLGNALFTRIFGRLDLTVWGIIFFPFLAARPLTIMALSRASQNTLKINILFARVLAILLLIPVTYTFWSVFKYFGVIRAMGGDHFRIKYRKMGLVNQGAFRFTDNAMYKFTFLLLWAIALYYRSYPALLLTISQHISIWVFYYCTEKPDMDLIYN